MRGTAKFFTCLIVVGIGCAILFSNGTTRAAREARTLSEDEAKTRLGLDEEWRPLKYSEHDFDDQGDVVIDHATGLMWQKSGSNEGLPYKNRQTYIDKLNHDRLAGYHDWRLPTVKELMSLLEPAKQSHGLYIHPIFDAKQQWCWSADTDSSELAWSVYFSIGLVYLDVVDENYYVRCVRSLH